jgi:hypothetical protein
VGGLRGGLAADLRKLAEKLGFKEFEGFSDLQMFAPIDWQYWSTYKWEGLAAAPISWRYQQ